MNNICAMNEKLLGKMNDTLTFLLTACRYCAYQEFTKPCNKKKAGEKSRVSSIQYTEGQSSQNGSKILASFLADLNKIKINKKAHFNLSNYCNDVIDFYKRSETKKKFYTAYEQEYNLFDDQKKQNYLGERSADLVTNSALLNKIDDLQRDTGRIEKRQTQEASTSTGDSQRIPKGNSNKSVLMRIVEFGVQLHKKYVEGVNLTKKKIDIMK